MRNRISATIFLLVSMIGFTLGQISDRYSFNKVYEQVKESVVTIEVEGTTIVDGKPKTNSGSGSGVIWDLEGFVITNKHVVQDNFEVDGSKFSRRTRSATVVLFDGRKLKAEIIGVAQDTDLALLKIIASNSSVSLKPIKIGDSDNIVVGEPVLALGSPFGFGGTLTHGIVSFIRLVGGEANVGFPTHPMIQTDAAINQGNSGGALVNLEGELIGMPTFLFSQVGTNAGINFAIPSNVIKKVAEDIKNEKTAIGYLGVTVQNLNQLSGSIKKQLNLKDESGVLISGVQFLGPAEKAGLKQGDVIVSLNERSIKDEASFVWTEHNLEPGSKIIIEIIRNGTTKKIEIEVGALNFKQP